ncbi:DUF6457 domain-containing protein [Solicola gregarius]|uniref:DUF6457 domain-containing protein n=1 Tax=Solicola gregarius TaxID=2908642 RepID=A0AA46TM61_9ACTN|nr:DUF6457 domain-containing protein [Solicola gregarius]UYM07610.1 DUF6457 domain-containing protein [Solicola gregarius]
MNLQQWTDEVRAALDIEVEPDLRAILDTARDVAHGVERPAAPVTAFLIGYAAGVRGGSVRDIEDVDAAVRNLVPTPPADDA